MREEDFIEVVKKWVAIDDMVKEATLKIREWKNEKKELEEGILEYMKKTDQDVLSMSTGGTLRMSLSKTKQGLKEDYIRDVLQKFIGDPNETAKIVGTLMSDRPQKERCYLKRCLPRKKT